MPTAALTCPGQELRKKLEVVRKIRQSMMAETLRLAVPTRFMVSWCSWCSSEEPHLFFFFPLNICVGWMRGEQISPAPALHNSRYWIKIVRTIIRQLRTKRTTFITTLCLHFSIWIDISSYSCPYKCSPCLKPLRSYVWNGFSHLEGMDRNIRIIFPGVRSENQSMHQLHLTVISQDFIFSPFWH